MTCDVCGPLFVGRCPHLPDPREAARQRLLRPLTDEEAASLHLVTPAEIDAAIRGVPSEPARWPNYR